MDVEGRFALDTARFVFSYCPDINRKVGRYLLTELR